MMGAPVELQSRVPDETSELSMIVEKRCTSLLAGLRRLARIGALITAAVGIGAGIAPASAGTLVVTNLGNAGAGSLRQALVSADPGDTITFAPELSGPIILGSALVVSIDNLTILGRPDIALDGNNAVQVLSLSAGVTVHLDSVVIQHGSSDYGGGILANGNLILTNCFVRNNHATNFGGGLLVQGPLASFTLINTFVIDNQSDDLAGGIYDAAGIASSITGSEIDGNISGGAGAGVYHDSPQTLTIDHSAISGNQVTNEVPSDGGGIASLGGTVDITYSTISANKAQIAGGIFAMDSTLNLTASLVAGNTAILDGGGIFVYGGILHGTNSTIAENVSALGAGGGISLQNSPLNNAAVTLLNSTVAFNRSATNGGGITLTSGKVTLGSTVIGSNVSPTNPDLQAAFVTLGLNLVKVRGTSSGYAGSDLPDGADPMFAPLSYNGGPTATLRLKAGSAAIGAISAAKCAPLDQRGYRRLGGSCDIGAFESDGIGDTVFANGFD